MLLEFPITRQNRTAAEGEVSFEATCRSAILQEGIFLEASACTSVIAVCAAGGTVTILRFRCFGNCVIQENIV